MVAGLGFPRGSAETPQGQGFCLHLSQSSSSPRLCPAGRRSWPPGHPHRRGHHSLSGLVAPARHLLTLASPRYPGLRVTWAEWVLPQSAWTGPCLTFCIWVSPLGAQLVECPVGRVPQQCGIPRGLTPGWGRSPGEGKWQPTPVFLPGGSPMDRGAWWATIHGVAVGHD